MNTLMAELPVDSNLQPIESSYIFDFGSDNYIWNFYHETQNNQKVRQYVLWLLVRLSKKGVVTEMREVLAETFRIM